MEVSEASAKYLARPGYRQTEVGMIPEDWDVRKLHSIVHAHNSGIYKSQKLYGNGCNIVGVSDIYSIEKVDGQFFATVPLSSQERNKHTLQCNDLLYGESSLVREGIARTVYVTERGAGTVFAWHTRRYSIDQRTVLSPYLYYYLQSRPGRAHMISQSIQTALTGINTGAYFACPIIVPPFAEQEAIAEALSDADAFIESLEQLIAKKRHLKQGAMQELLTGKKRLPGFSGEWAIRTFAELFNFSGGFSASRDQLSSEGHCYLHYGDIHKSSKTFIDVRSEYQEIPKLNIALKRISPSSFLDDGDVVFVDASEDDDGASKHIVIINKDKTPYIAGLHTIVAKSKTDAFDHTYLRYCFQTPDIKRQFYYYAVGTKVTGISKTNIAKLVLSLPSRPEQTAIATILSDMDAELAALETKLAKARSLKQGMMHNLLTGKIRLV